MSNSLHTFIEMIRTDFPALQIRSARRIPIGLDHVVLEINGRYIFQISASEPRSMEHEIAVIRLLHQNGVRIVPAVSFVGKNSQYFGYKKIEGVTLSEDEAGRIPAADRRRLAVQIARFLVQLHCHISLAQAREWGIPEYDLKRFNHILPVITEKFSDDRDLVTFARRAVLESAGIGSDASLRRVLHWDLHNGNLILDSTDHSLRG